MINLLVNSNATIREAIEKINNNGKQIVFCINNDNEVLGSITDGDIRRALIKGLNINDNITQVINKDFKYIKKAEKGKMRLIMEKHTIRHIPLLNENNHFVKLYTYEDILGQINDVPILLFAGGEGKRLHPVTIKTPKPLLSIGGKPIIEMIVDRMINMGFINIYIALHYKSHMIKESMEQAFPDYFNKNNYIFEKSPKGTAGSLSYFLDSKYEHIITHNSDIITDVNIRMMLEDHKKNNNDSTICLTTFSYSFPYGFVKTRNNEIINIDEKPGYNGNILSGINIFSKSVFNLFEDNELNMNELLEKAINHKKKIGYYIHSGFWSDIGEMNIYRETINKFGGK